MQGEARSAGVKLIPKYRPQGSLFYTDLSGELSARRRAEQCEVKYFLMGISVILVLWVGTFVMMVE